MRRKELKRTYGRRWGYINGFRWGFWVIMGNFLFENYVIHLIYITLQKSTKVAASHNPCLFLIISSFPNIIMSNKGQTNHRRFRTKFWQERQSQPLQTASFLDSTLITGKRITHRPFRNPAILIDPPSDMESTPVPLRRGSAGSSNSKRDSRMALKL